jgi:tRNA threonylcarbamoyladenosine biosynthesis protein TsaE
MTGTANTPALLMQLELKTLYDVAASILEAADARIFLVNGPMGSGKTTLVKAFCTRLGSRDEFSSPTYSIVNEYASGKGRIFHFDLYRLTEAAELYDIGFEEYLDSGAYCFIEWPRLAESLIESRYVKIEIEMRDDMRFVSLYKPVN